MGKNVWSDNFLGFYKLYMAILWVNFWISIMYFFFCNTKHGNLKYIKALEVGLWPYSRCVMCRRLLDVRRARDHYAISENSKLLTYVEF